MTKNTIMGMVGIGLLLAAILGIYSVRNTAEKLTEERESSSQPTAVISVDKVVRAPGQYKGFVGVEGVVAGIDESKGMFLLGCEDACIAMPVKYGSQMPEVKSQIVVYGEITEREDGRYVFQGKEVKPK